MRARIAVLAAAVLTSAAWMHPGSATGQEPDAVVERVMQAWGGSDTRPLGELLDPRGVHLRLDAEEHSGVSPRQARAALDDVLGRHEPGEIGLLRIEIPQGTPPRGFAELRWVTRPRGAREEVTYIIFLRLELQEDRWWISEIRILQ